jgi:hypothetical protein
MVMLILKRLAVWLLETSFEVFLLSLFLTVFLGFDQHALFREILVFAGGIVLVFTTTGYLLTTAIFRACWKSQKVWSYPAIASVLFLVHFEILDLGIRGVFEPSDRPAIRVAGVCIALTCTVAGSFVLRRWVRASSKLEDASNDGRPTP